MTQILIVKKRRKKINNKLGMLLSQITVGAVVAANKNNNET